MERKILGNAMKVQVERESVRGYIKKGNDGGLG